MSLDYTVNGETFAIVRRPEIAGTTKRPVVVMLHGVDGLSEFSRPQIIGFAEEVAGAGYAVFVATYFGATDGTIGGFLEPADQAVLGERIRNVNSYGPRVAEA